MCLKRFVHKMIKTEITCYDRVTQTKTMLFLHGESILLSVFKIFFYLTPERYASVA